MTDAERKAQITAFSVAHGHAGYLREAYHGSPYATRVLVPEAFEDPTGYGVGIEAATLRERLTAALDVARERQSLVYKEPPESEDTRRVLKSITDFVELCERKERETGEPVRITASF